MPSDASEREVGSQSDNVATASQIVKWRRQASRLRRQDANAIHEAAMIDWLATGCPADRTGIMGVLLLGMSSAVKARISDRNN